MQIVFATANKNKIIEIQQLLPNHIKLVSLSEIGCVEDIPETQNTIEGNAYQKANYINVNYKCNCFADDTGLEIKTLNGAPGVLSARYAGEDKKAEDNISKVLEKLENKTDRSARFKTVISLFINDQTVSFEGIVNGTILDKHKGNSGFGYDPIFAPNTLPNKLPNTDQITFAEMTVNDKNIISHRGIAVRKLVDYLSSL